MSQDGALIGGIIGGVFFLAAVGFLVWYFYRSEGIDQIQSHSTKPGVIGEECDTATVVVSDTVFPRVRRKKIDYIVDAVLGKVFPKDKELATVANSGALFVDHHFVSSVPSR